MNNRISVEIALLLSNTSFSIDDMEEWYRHTYTKGSIVREDAYKRFGELTDDGFYELTKDGGGDLDWDEIYTNDWHLTNHYPMDDEKFLLCPTLDEVRNYFLKKKKLQITVYSCSQESWQYRITKPNQNLEDGIFGEDFDSYENALIDAIKVLLK